MNDTLLITNADELYPNGSNSIQWTADPVFEFETEIDALQTMEALGEDLRSAREEIRHIMRYMEAAARAAHTTGTAADGKVSPQAIINHCGVGRQTVYNWIKPKE